MKIHKTIRRILREDLVSKGLAIRLGPDEDYIPPTEVPEKNMWKIKSGYKLI